MRRDIRHPMLLLFLLVAFAAGAGCGSDDSTTTFMVSPPGWVENHSGGQHAKSATSTFISSGGTTSCAECHGVDLGGGTAKVSCYTNPAGCHHDPVVDWVASSPAAQGHGAAAKQAPASSGAGFASCQICHGMTFSGGGSQVSCFGTPCHAGDAPHPSAPWLGSAYTHTTTDEPGNAPVCSACHAYAGTPNPNNPIVPPSPASAGTAPGCFNGTMCHNRTSHAVPFDNTAHYSVTGTTFTANCGSCHDVTGTSPVSDAPVCTACHAAGSPLTSLNCTSCHTDPPSGASAAYPNVAGAHATHNDLAGTGTMTACDACHNGLGTGTLNHYNRANALPGKDALRVAPGDVAFLAAYNAKSGTAAFNSENRTCSNVICHGGQATPDWQTATTNVIDVPNACLNCHVSGTTQYNSYNSGMHARHIFELGLSASTCKQCHDAAKVNVSGHFQNLATPGFEQPAANTILSDVQYNGNSCNPSCHRRRNW